MNFEILERKENSFTIKFNTLNDFNELDNISVVQDEFNIFYPVERIEIIDKFSMVAIIYFDPKEAYKA